MGFRRFSKWGGGNTRKHKGLDGKLEKKEKTHGSWGGGLYPLCRLNIFFRGLEEREVPGGGEGKSLGGGPGKFGHGRKPEDVQGGTAKFEMAQSPWGWPAKLMGDPWGGGN